ncbi:MAG: hypothetical protein JO258_11580, partial [Alphaproteobacteria bacterium]|nr:hypothetical protein [Alphaproteobacteria bacterium]
MFGPVRKRSEQTKSTGAEPGRRSLSAGGIYFAGLVFVAIAIASASIAIWEFRRNRIDDELQHTHDLAVVLAAQTARNFQAIDLVLQEAERLVTSAGVDTPEQFRRTMASEEFHRLLVDRLRVLPQADAISLIDDAGRIVNSSRTWPAQVIDTSDRDFYAYWRGHNRAGVFLGMPVVNKVTGAWVLTVTRRIESADGEFLGIALAVIELRYFEEFYGAIRTREGQSITLFR